MNIQIQQVSVADVAYQEVWQLREDILRQPIGLSLKNEDLSGDAEDIILAAIEDGKVIGCLMLTYMNEATLKLRQMAVHTEWQGKGVGAQLVTAAESLAQTRGYKKIMMHARQVAIGFYQSLGYRIVSDEFTEVGVPHFIMEKAL